jgi:AraC-like DNA-binding protein
MEQAGLRNLVLTGKAYRYATPDYAGPISLKSVRQGSIRWTTSERSYQLHPDTLFILNRQHGYTMEIDGKELSQTFCPVFRDGLIESALRCISEGDERLLDEPFGAPPVMFRERIQSRFSALGACLTRLVDAVDRRASGVELDWHFEMLGAAVARNIAHHRGAEACYPSARPSTRNEIVRRLERARHAIEDDLARHWRLADMAAMAAMAAHHFHRCWVRVFGITPGQYLSRRRLERAAALLGTSGRSVTEVCLEVGYSSLPSFINSFRSHFGAPPSRHRRESGSGRASEDASIY